jgi:hypothetical protein
MFASRLRSWAQAFFRPGWFYQVVWAVIVVALGTFLLAPFLLVWQLSAPAILALVIAEALILVVFLSWMTSDLVHSRKAVHRAHGREMPTDEDEMAEVAGEPKLPPWMAGR